MATQCAAQVRGSMIRLTELTRLGQPVSPVRYAVSKSVAAVRLEEETESGSNEMLRSDYNDEPRVLLRRSGDQIKFVATIEFRGVDPAVLSLTSGQPVAVNAQGDLVGFDARSKLPVRAFALEVWTKLAGDNCAEGERQWGYTLFPFLKGGRISGFRVSRDNSLSFNIIGAQTRKAPRWSVGPHDLQGPFQRLVSPVTRNTMYRNVIIASEPPVPFKGVKEFEDFIEGGSATLTTDDVIEGGSASSTTAWIIEGGYAA